MTGALNSRCRTIASLLLLIAFTGSVWLSSASALELDVAKSKGLVGEKHNGYLAAVHPRPSDDVAKLVADINSRRRVKYSSIARSNGTSLKAVEALAGKKTIQITPADQYVQLSDEVWVKKGTVTAVP